jgi:hypothetical protein
MAGKAKKQGRDGIRIGRFRMSEPSIIEVRKAITSISRHDSLSVVLFIVTILVAVLAGALSGRMLLSALVLAAGLIQQYLRGKFRVDRQRNRILGLQARLKRGERSPQFPLLRLPPPTEPGDHDGGAAC